MGTTGLSTRSNCAERMADTDASSQEHQFSADASVVSMDLTSLLQSLYVKNYVGPGRDSIASTRASASATIVLISFGKISRFR